MKKQNPGAGKRQGLHIETAFSNTVRIAVPLDFQPEFAPVAWLAARARVSVETAKVFAELNRFGEART